MELEIVDDFIVKIEYEVNKHGGKVIPNITKITHNKINITDILNREILDSIRSKIFKQLNEIS